MAENILTRFITKERFFPYALKFTALLGISIAAPFFHFQAITGTIVNAALIVAVVMLGKKEAITIGMFPSLISVVTGLLAPAVAPLIPFIILGNALLIFAFSVLRKESYWKGIVAGSILKFSFLFFAAAILSEIFEGKNFAKIAMTMFSWQQLLTALSGGIVAYGALKILKKI
ncbi:MAG: iron hydrogenase [Patescibacteria group bacterium]